MKKLLALIVLCTGVGASAAELEIRSNLQLTPDHLPQPAVPRGKLEGPFEFHSQVFAGTSRLYWLFVPAQYDSSKPASVLVFQDGQRAVAPQGSTRVPQVMENLIARGAMPVTIGIFITPGNLSEHYPDNYGQANPNHRADEYDALNDSYARFLIDELLPEVGKRYRLTTDPEQRAIGGTSSGAICAFTVAWQRPDQFRKVFSAIGSYTSIGFRPNETPIKLGGQDYPALIRRTAIKPLRVFLQDGNHDLDNEWGNWFLANQQMVTAFAYANRNADAKNDQGPRYRIQQVWTDGEHSDKDGGALLPEALQWLWASP